MSVQKLSHRSSKWSIGVCSLVTGATLMAGGCGGSAAVNTDVRKPAAERPDVDRAAVASGSLSIPAKAAFNLTSVKSAQSGQARGAAELVSNNGAKCNAEAREGGTAWGEFQLGYCFDNVAEQPLQAVVKMRLKVTASVSSATSTHVEATSGKETTQGAGSLLFCIKDTNGIMLKKEQLFAGDLEKGAGATSDVCERAFDVRFEPQRGYYLFVAGRVDAQAAAAQSAACALDVSEYTTEIEWQPAPPLGGAGAPAAGAPPQPAAGP